MLAKKSNIVLVLFGVLFIMESCGTEVRRAICVTKECKAKMAEQARTAKGGDGNNREDDDDVPGAAPGAPAAENPAGTNQPAAGDSADTAEPAEGASQNNAPIFETPELGVLVKAARNTVVRPLPTDDDPSNPIAMASFSMAGFEFVLRVYPKAERETLLQWGHRAYAGDSFLSGRTEGTRDNRDAHVYSTNDLGLLPDIHVMIAARRYVYRFDWDDPRVPHDPEEALIFMRYGKQQYMAVPMEFIAFIRGIEVSD